PLPQHTHSFPTRRSPDLRQSTGKHIGYVTSAVDRLAHPPQCLGGDGVRSVQYSGDRNGRDPGQFGDIGDPDPAGAAPSAPAFCVRWKCGSYAVHDLSTPSLTRFPGYGSAVKTGCSDSWA